MRKLLLSLLLISLFAVAAQAQGLAPWPGGLRSSGCSPSDSFAGADHSSLSGNWTVSMGSWEILSHSAHALTVAAFNVAYWNQCSLGADQTSSSVVNIGSAGFYVGAAVRWQTGSQSGYVCVVDPNASSLQRIDSGGGNPLGTGATVATGHTLALAITGTSLVCSDNGTTIISATDATYATGKVGIAAFDSGNSLITSWSAH